MHLIDVIPIVDNATFSPHAYSKNEEKLDFYIYLYIADIGWVSIASVEDSVFTYMGNESSDTVWPGEVYCKITS